MKMRNKFYSFLAIVIFLTFFLQSCSKGLTLKQVKAFDITKEATPFFLEKTVRDKTVMQSIAFDNVNEHVYVLQVMGGDQRVGDETVHASWRTRSQQGDLTLTKLDYEGNQLGHMHLKGFGHGVSMGIEMEGDTPYIWLETDAVSDGSNAWGNKLARITFEDRGLLDAKKDDIEKFVLVEGADHTTVNIDQAFNLLTLRYRLDHQFYYSVFPLDEVKEGKYEAIYTFEHPEEIDTFQGFASHGPYLYLLEGNETDESGGNTYVYSVDLEKGAILDKQFIDVGMDLPFREPEGMAISIPDLDQPDQALLHFGFASEHRDYAIKLVNIFTFEERIRE